MKHRPAMSKRMAPEGWGTQRKRELLREVGGLSSTYTPVHKHVSPIVGVPLACCLSEDEKALPSRFWVRCCSWNPWEAKHGEIRLETNRSNDGFPQTLRPAEHAGRGVALCSAFGRKNIAGSGFFAPQRKRVWYSARVPAMHVRQISPHVGFSGREFGFCLKHHPLLNPD